MRTTTHPCWTNEVRTAGEVPGLCGPGGEEANEMHPASSEPTVLSRHLPRVPGAGSESPSTRLSFVRVLGVGGGDSVAPAMRRPVESPIIRISSITHLRLT